MPTPIKIKKALIEKILNDFQDETHTLFRDPDKARMLIEYAIGKFVTEGVESNKV